MTRRRVFSEAECKALAEWYASRSTIRDKAREKGVSMGTLRDAILRGQGKDSGYIRRKIEDYLATVPRETEQESQISEVA